MKKQLEKPFEYLKHKDGSPFSPEIVNHWYEARAYVLDKLKDVAIGPDSSNHLHVVVTSDTPLMLAAVRQVGLSAHYPNFDDLKDGNKTVITLVSGNERIMDELAKEEYLSNLSYYCINTKYTDIELQIAKGWDPKDDTDAVIMSEEDMKSFLSSKSPEEVYSIDTRKAVIADRIYSIGTLIDNLPAEDIHNINRYTMALDTFQYRLLTKEMQPLIQPKRWADDLSRVKNGLSNIFCTDCFESRAKCLSDKYTEAYSKSEHARWLTEKLIMGFRPLNKMERIHDERSLGIVKAEYRRQLKKNPSDPVHIDICDYSNLRRIDPESLKYDTFLMLAIPMILNFVKS